MKLKLLVISSFTAQPLQESLRYWLEQFEIPHTLEFAPYSQVFQQLLDPASAFARNTDGANFILVRIEDWVQGGTDAFATRLTDNVNDFIGALSFAQERSANPVWLCLCPPSERVLQDPVRAGRVRELEALIAERASQLAGVQVLHGSDIARYYGLSQVNDPAADAAGHVPYTPDYFAALGTALVRRILEPIASLPAPAALPEAETRIPAPLASASMAQVAPGLAPATVQESSAPGMFEELICGILEISPAELSDELNRSSLASWSSLAHINLVTALEETYGVSFTTQEILTLDSVGGARGLLRRRGIAV